MAINFPDSPSTNDTHTVNGKVWRYDGEKWGIVGAAVPTSLANLTISGDFTVDTSTLHVDSTNNRVGIGTTSPTVPLDIHNATAVEINLNDSGGTVGASTNAKLQFQAGGADAGHVGFSNTSSGIMTITQENGPLWINQKSANNILFRTSDTTQMTLNSSGNLGIGTTSPGTPLSFGTPSDGSRQIGLYETGSVGYGIGTDSNRVTIFASNASTYEERLVVRGDTGRVGIGTTSPSGMLAINKTLGTGANDTEILQEFVSDVGGGNTSFLRVSNIRESAGGSSWTSAHHRIQHRVDASDMAYIDFNPETAEQGLALGTGNTEKVTIDYNGKVGIGETSPAFKLVVNDYSSGNRTYPLMVTNGTAGGGGVANTEAAIWFSASNSTATSRGAYISAVNTGGGSNGHDLVFAVSANTAFPSEGMRLDLNKQLIHHRSGAFCGGPSSWTSGYKNYWSVARSRGTFLTAGNGGITVNRSGFYYVRYVQRSDGTGGPYAGIGESGNRSTLENRTTGIWTHDHGGSDGAHLESVYVGYLAANELLTAGAVNSGSAADLVFSTSTWAGILYAIYLGE